jgi:hypothetical protein
MKTPKRNTAETVGLQRLVRALERIATSLELVVDRKKRTLRMVDVDRGKVYKTHLGGKLKK